MLRNARGRQLRISLKYQRFKEFSNSCKNYIKSAGGQENPLQYVQSQKPKKFLLRYLRSTDNNNKPTGWT